MPVWPKRFYTFGISLKTAGTEWTLRQKREASIHQERARRALLPRLAASRYWRQAGIEPKMSYAAFQARVPLQTYEQLVPAIERMRCGEADVLWPGRCSLFALSSGTTTGQPKCLPVTGEMLAHFRHANLATLLYYNVRVKHAGVFRGRHLALGGSTALVPLPEAKPHAAYAGETSGIAQLNQPRWAERYLYEPGAAAAQVNDWTAKLDAIVARTRQLDITLLAGIPPWALTLIHTLRARCSVPHLQTLWPNLECFLHRGVPIGPFHAELRAVLGPKVRFHEVYSAAEGTIAAQDGEPVAGLRLMADSGLFCEFLPAADYEEARLAQLGPKVVPLSGVKAGVDYVLVLTTPSGLARYVTGDVVRFASVKPPRLFVVGRTKLQLNTFGERVIEKELTDALVAVCQRHNWMTVNFHVAPLQVGSFVSQNRKRHEWWVELKPGTVETPTGPQMATELDAELIRLNPEYAARRRAGALEPPFVRLVMPGVFEHWLRFHGKWGGEHKTARCRSDRMYADELAQITNFARD